MNEQLFTAHKYVYHQKSFRNIIISLSILFFCAFLILFLPWTQNIRARGAITTLKQDQRPQQVNTLIAGRIDKWYVKEGDFVKAGDTLLKLSEIKAEYLDPQLLQRTAEQVKAKNSSINYYRGKVDATEKQMDALKSALQVKLLQLENKSNQAEVKIQSDSMDLVAAMNDLKIASAQLERQRVLYDSGLVSLTQLEQRNQAFQSALAKKTSVENRLISSRQELQIVNAEFRATQQDYAEKFSKAESDRFGSLSSIAQSEGEVAKLENQYSSYRLRNDMYHVIAPQSGQVIRAKKAGIGEAVKEGEWLVSIVPGNIEYAVEMYVRPVDLPLISAGQKVRFLFDGFPAIVFSGWPEASYGTFQGVINAVESDRSENGMFRVIVRQDDSYRKWPGELKMGTGASGIALLKTVPVWYELWRMINSFPKDYYRPQQAETKQ